MKIEKDVFQERKFFEKNTQSVRNFLKQSKSDIMDLTESHLRKLKIIRIVIVKQTREFRRI